MTSPFRSTRPLRRAAVVCTGLSLALVAGCGGSQPPAAPEPSASQATSAAVVETSPLTGQPYADGTPKNPVFVVKIENTAAGAPQTSLDRADLVVEELVEGGVTRLAAFFHTEVPDSIGHVRSERGTDIGIAGPVAGQIVATGGADETVAALKRADITTFTEDEGAPGFSTDPAKKRPYNRLVDLTVIAREAKKTKIPGPYLAFTPAGGPAAPVGRPVSRASVKFSGATTTNWAFADGVWRRTNGHAAEGQDFAASTLIVVFAPVRNAGYRDPAGNPVPETVFEGSGRGVVLAGGNALDVTWTKSGLDSMLTFTDAAGAPVTIAPGRVWIELVPTSGAASAS